jgi:acyl dehydratase
MHGLNFFGFAMYAVITSALSGKAELVKSVTIRFVRPVTPGSTLTTRIWQQNAQTLIIEQLAATPTDAKPLRCLIGVIELHQVN